MPKAIEREELKQKLERDEDFELIEVLEEEDYQESHIKGAINIPLKEIGRKAKQRFDPDQEIVVYCSNADCQASPKAARKLEDLGFTEVYDYEEGKADWKAAGYPTEGG